MVYEEIWKKVLSPNEVVQYEFSIGQKFLKIQTIVLCIIFVPFLFVPFIGIPAIGIVLFYNLFYQKRAHAYAFTNKRVLIHRGWLGTRTTSVDYNHITDVHVLEPFVERVIYKSGSIAINTAGSSNLEIVLRHIDAPYEIKKKLDALKG